MDIEDDSDNDSDYRPEDDNDLCDKSNGGNLLEKKLVALSNKTKRTVDQLWRSMQEEDRTYVQLKMNSSLHSLRHNLDVDDSCRKHNFQILKDIFGLKVAKQITSTHSIDGHNERSDMESNRDQMVEIQTKSIISTDESRGPTDLRKRSMESVGKVVKKRKITETRKFAGKEIK